MLVKIFELTDKIVLMDPELGPKEGHFENLRRIDHRDDLVWKAPLPVETTAYDCFTEVEWNGEWLEAKTYSGYTFWIHPKDGMVMDWVNKDGHGPFWEEDQKLIEESRMMWAGIVNEIDAAFCKWENDHSEDADEHFIQKVYSILKAHDEKDFIFSYLDQKRKEQKDAEVV